METLIIEDDPATRAILTHLLAARGHQAVACESAEQAVERYRLSFYPLVLLDLCLPGMSGFEFCRWLRTQPDGERPYILIGTGSNDTGDLRQILDAGADDYIVKPYGPALFAVRLTIAEQSLHARAARRLLEEDLRRERDRLNYLGSHDPLTKLHSREKFSAALDTAVASAAENLSPGALLYVDLDHFRIVNHSLGHAAGDRLLVQIAYALRNAVRGQDVVGRFGGDEFLVLQENVTLAEARLTAERIRGRVGDFVFSDSGRNFPVAASVGVAEITGRVPAEHILAAADAACHAAKQRGRGRVEIHHPHDGAMTQARQDALWSSRLRHALKANTVELWFQPVVEIGTGRVKFHEAQPRLCTEEGEIVESPLFMPAAERCHLAAEIDRRVVRRAVRQLAAEPALHLAIRLSGQSLDEPGLPEFIRKSFAAESVAPGRATFEIGERAILSRLDSTRALMQELHGGGFRFALGDFGAGFSSFSYLKDLPVNCIRIDGGFIRELLTEPVNKAFVKVMSDIARHLQIDSVAEQVESAETVKALGGMGVPLAQGRYFGASVPEPAW